MSRADASSSIWLDSKPSFETEVACIFTWRCIVICSVFTFTTFSVGVMPPVGIAVDGWTVVLVGSLDHRVSSLTAVGIFVSCVVVLAPTRFGIFASR